MSKPKKPSAKMQGIKNLICLSDLHSGCQLGLCPPNGIRLDEGGTYLPSVIQQKIYAYWREFWDEWIPRVTKGEPYGIAINGDAMDGIHHGATHQISHNLQDQEDIAYELLAPEVERAEGRLYMIRGTEAHVGKSGVQEESLACRLGAIPNELGQRARYELWKQVGPGLVHIMHHIGVTGSQAYEATAVHKELVEAFTESGRWNNRPPDIVVRSHRHRLIHTHVPTSRGEAIAIVTPGWQAKTPFAWKVAGARQSVPQFGGILIRYGDEDLFVRTFVRDIARPTVE